MTTNSTAAIRRALSTWRAEREERREARAARRSLEQQLASYYTPREVEDFLSLIANVEGPEAEQMRDILTNNLLRSA
jgi:hypothetical protein